MRRFITYVLGGLIVLIAVWSLMGALVAHVFRDEVLRVVDRPLAEVVLDQRAPNVDGTMQVITDLGGNVTVWLVLGTAALMIYLRTKDTRYPAFLFTVMGGGQLLSNVIKLTIQRPRPRIDPLFEVGGFSWPSGHAIAGAVVWLSLALLITEGRAKATKIAVWSAAVVIGGVVAASRVYLGVHWPTDVVGGYLLGASWVAIAARATGIVPR